MELEWTTTDTNYQYRMERTDRLGRRHSSLDTCVLERIYLNSNRGSHYTYGYRMARGDSYTVLAASVVQAVFGADPKAQRTMT